MSKLSTTQKKALERLTRKWECAYSLGFSLTTLNSLVRRGLAEVRYLPGTFSFPRVGTEYRLRKSEDE